jgi:molybdopterin-containing oxidoreductase family membrane subunit
MWTAAAMAVAGVWILLTPRLRRNEGWLALGCALVFVATWIDKGMALVPGGLAPTPFETISDYSPTIREVVIAVGVYGLGALILTVLYKIAISVKQEPQSA